MKFSESGTPEFKTPPMLGHDTQAMLVDLLAYGAQRIEDLRGLCDGLMLQCQGRIFAGLEAGYSSSLDVGLVLKGQRTARNYLLWFVLKDGSLPPLPSLTALHSNWLLSNHLDK